MFGLAVEAEAEYCGLKQPVEPQEEEEVGGSDARANGYCASVNYSSCCSIFDWAFEQRAEQQQQQRQQQLSNIHTSADLY